jgi:putative serine protease PepD
MSQSTDPRPDVWSAPWAAPAPGAADDSTTTPGSGFAPHGASAAPPGAATGTGLPGPDAGTGTGTPFTAPPLHQDTQPLPGGGGLPPFGTADPGRPGGDGGPRRERRRPGWTGVVAVGAGAAVLSSLLTAGMVSLTDRTTSGSSPAATSSSTGTATQSAPLVTSSSQLPDWVAVAGAVEPSVVSVKITAGQAQGEGSGVILDAQGRILTNNHVISGAGNGGISVVLSDGRTFPASVVGTDPSTDLAVLKLNPSVSGLKPATFGDSSAVKIGDPVMAIGNPLGYSDTVTTGIVSALNRPVAPSSGQGDPFGGGSSTAEDPVTNAIQTDAAINPGNSGGALVDSGGRVIGITSSIASLSVSGGESGSIGLGFAIPINEAKQIADQLVSTGKVQHAFLGVKLSDNTITLDGAQREAAVINEVTSGSPAATAGIKAGDAVIAINGQPVDSVYSLIGSIRALKPGTKVTLTVVRGGSSQQLPVTLATASNNG